MENLTPPTHIGLIMDGNGRWAKKRLLPRTLGHKAGMNAMIDIAESAQSLGVKYLTVYTLSAENLNRPKDEIDGLFNLIRKYFSENLKKLYKKNARIKVIGETEVLPPDIQALLKDGEKNSPEDYTFTLIFAINYGGKQEILSAVNRAVSAGQPLTEKEFEKLLYTDGVPFPDLIIRTGGEMRLSNFLLYQSAYSELYFCDTLFPDFDKKHLQEAIKDFNKRDRRFGNV